jgi:hypothetical protein
MNQRTQWTVEIVVDAPLERVWDVADDIMLIHQTTRRSARLT